MKFFFIKAVPIQLNNKRFAEDFKICSISQLWLTIRKVYIADKSDKFIYILKPNTTQQKKNFKFNPFKLMHHKQQQKVGKHKNPNDIKFILICISRPSKQK